MRQDREFWEKCVLACLNNGHPEMTTDYAVFCADGALKMWRDRWQEPEPQK